MSPVSTTSTADAVDALRSVLSIGDTVYLIRRHRSRRGNQIIGLLRFTVSGTPMPITIKVASALSLEYDQLYDGVCVGPGRSAWLVNELSRVLFGQPNQLQADWL